MFNLSDGQKHIAATSTLHPYVERSAMPALIFACCMITLLACETSGKIRSSNLFERLAVRSNASSHKLNEWHWAGKSTNRSLVQSEDLSGYQLKDYTRSQPSDFEMCYTNKGFCDSSEQLLNYAKWRNLSLSFVGGSVTRQMHEQLLWELPEIVNRSPMVYQSPAGTSESLNQSKDASSSYIGGHFLFERSNEPNREFVKAGG
jgi:hypothetical protein